MIRNPHFVEGLKFPFFDPLSPSRFLNPSFLAPIYACFPGSVVVLHAVGQYCSHATLARPFLEPLGHPDNPQKTFRKPPESWSGFCVVFWGFSEDLLGVFWAFLGVVLHPKGRPRAPKRSHLFVFSYGMYCSVWIQLVKAICIERRKNLQP